MERPPSLLRYDVDSFRAFLPAAYKYYYDDNGQDAFTIGPTTFLVRANRKEAFKQFIEPSNRSAIMNAWIRRSSGTQTCSYSRCSSPIPPLQDLKQSFAIICGHVFCLRHAQTLGLLHELARCPLCRMLRVQSQRSTGTSSHVSLQRRQWSAE